MAASSSVARGIPLHAHFQGAALEVQTLRSDTAAAPPQAFIGGGRSVSADHLDLSVACQHLLKAMYLIEQAGIHRPLVSGVVIALKHFCTSQVSFSTFQYGHGQRGYLQMKVSDMRFPKWWSVTYGCSWHRSQVVWVFGG